MTKSNIKGSVKSNQQHHIVVVYTSKRCVENPYGIDNPYGGKNESIKLAS